jgi:diguanylate cyclase (GGDEF)-like protein
MAFLFTVVYTIYDMENAKFRALEHIWKLLKEDAVPELDEELRNIPRLQEIHHELKALRELADSLRDEINLRNLSMAALQERESRFKYLASHDPLTGALNRRSFMERAGLELKTAALAGVTCGIVMMDLDHFKIFNDTWGHQAGDEALRHVVKVMGSLLRKNDFLGRYGGEEFVFFFSHAGRNTGIAIAERMRKAIAGTSIQLESAQASITASFGVCILDHIEGAAPTGCADENFNDDVVVSLEALIHNADLALYRAKAEGRNRVVCF